MARYAPQKQKSNNTVHEHLKLLSFACLVEENFQFFVFLPWFFHWPIKTNHHTKNVKTNRQMLIERLPFCIINVNFYITLEQVLKQNWLPEFFSRSFITIFLDDKLFLEVIIFINSKQLVPSFINFVCIYLFSIIFIQFILLFFILFLFFVRISIRFLLCGKRNGFEGRGRLNRLE